MKSHSTKHIVPESHVDLLYSVDISFFFFSVSRKTGMNDERAFTHGIEEGIDKKNKKIFNKICVISFFCFSLPYRYHNDTTI